MKAIATPDDAIRVIDTMLREEHPHYCFTDLADRFAADYDEAVAVDDEYVTIKIPSACEFSVHRDTVRLALMGVGGLRRRY